MIMEISSMTNLRMNLFCEKLESLQYKTAVEITGAIEGTSRDKIYQKLGLVSRKSRTWYTRLSCMFKIMKKVTPNYLINLIPKCQAAIRIKNNNFLTYNSRTDCFKYSFFPSTLNDWLRLDIYIRNSEKFYCLKVSNYLSFVQIRVTYIFDPIGLKLLTRLHLGLSHLN